MKVMIVNMYYFPNMLGGAEHSVQLLAEHIVKMGNQVSVLTMDGKVNEDILNPEYINGVYVYRAHSSSIYKRRIQEDKSHLSDKIWNGFHSIYNMKMNKNIKYIIEKVQPDVIHTNNLVSMSYWIWKYAQKKRIPLVHTLRDYWLLDPTTQIGGSNPIIVKMFRKIFCKVSNDYRGMLTAPSDKTLEIFNYYSYFQNCFKCKVVNSIEFDDKLLIDCMQEKSIRKSKIIRFIYVGKLDINKGISTLLEAFCDIEISQIKLIICGDGPLRNLVENISNDSNGKIEFKGKLGQKELIKQYREADVIIVPSIWEEPFGRIVIEAAQYALPIIGSNRGGIPETIENLEYGECYNADSKQELKDLIIKFSNREYIQKYVQKKPNNLKQYSIDVQINKFLEIYYCVINGK